MAKLRKREGYSRLKERVKLSTTAYWKRDASQNERGRESLGFDDSLVCERNPLNLEENVR